MAAAADRVIKRVRGKGRGWVFTPKDFLDLGTRASVDVALSRLAQQGHIRRIGRGLYDYPKVHAKLGALTPDTDTIAKAVASQSGNKISTSGAQTANLMGISNQVPARASYVTSGPSRVKKVAGRTIAFKRSRAPILDNATPDANAVLQLLSYLGKAQLDDEVIQRCADQLNLQDIKALKKAQAAMPGWMSDAVLKISMAHHG
jgi:hypothetical protein